jgi:hypothetical protein
MNEGIWGGCAMAAEIRPKVLKTQSAEIRAKVETLATRRYKTSPESAKIRAKILTLCTNEYKTSTELAAVLRIPFHTLRAHYLYRMKAEGLLKPLHPGRHPRQAYTKA